MKGNISDLMQQAQKMQADMQKAQESWLMPRCRARRAPGWFR